MFAAKYGTIFVGLMSTMFCEHQLLQQAAVLHHVGERDLEDGCAPGM